MKKLIIPVLAILPLVSNAQAALSLDDCISMAKENNKQIEASDWLLKSTQYDSRSAKSYFFPSISVSGNALYSTIDGGYSSGVGQLPVLDANGMPTGQTAYFPGIDLKYRFGWIFSAGVQFEQPIYMGGKIMTAYRMSKIGTEIARQNKRLTESEVIVETSKAYATVVRCKELIQVATSYNTLLKELMRSVESAKKHGMKTQNDVLKVQVKLDESELTLRRAENGYRLAMMNLCHYIGRPLTDNIDIDGDLPSVNASANQSTDITARPEYQILEGKSELAHNQISLARSEYLPQVGLVGQYGYANGVKLNGTKLLDNWNFLVGLQVSIPIYDFGRRSSKINSARAKYEQALAEQEDTNNKLALDVMQSYNNLDEAVLERSLAETSVTSAEENLRSSRLQYEHGVETLSDYLEAQTLWLQANETLIDARNNCYVRLLEYQKATGSIN